MLSQVYAARDAYAAEHGYDLDRIYADLKNREAVSSLRRLPLSPPVPSPPAAPETAATVHARVD